MLPQVEVILAERLSDRPVWAEHCSVQILALKTGLYSIIIANAEAESFTVLLLVLVSGHVSAGAKRLDPCG